MRKFLQITIDATTCILMNQDYRIYWKILQLYCFNKNEIEVINYWNINTFYPRQLFKAVKISGGKFFALHQFHVAKILRGEISTRQNFRVVKFPLGEVSVKRKYPGVKLPRTVHFMKEWWNPALFYLRSGFSLQEFASHLSINNYHRHMLVWNGKRW